MLILYITIIILLPYISYEDPVQLTTPTTDPYHICHHEVRTVLTTRYYIAIVYIVYN